MSRGVRLALAIVCVLASAAPLASGAPVKRGIASARYLVSNPTKLAQLGASWAYDWSAKPPPGTRGLMWVPMMWGPGSVTPTTLAELRAAHARYLLGFNEPDLTSQSNVTPERAAALWPRLERTGLILGSPAPAVPGDGWLARFMALAARRRLRVDFVALHYYQDFTDRRAVSDLRRQLVSIHAEYRRPIWITEIGAIDLRSWHEPMMRAPTAALAARYMRRLFAMLDALPFVERYAWFTDDCWADVACRFGSLFTSRGRLTLAGRRYSIVRRRRGGAGRSVGP